MKSYEEGLVCLEKKQHQITRVRRTIRPHQTPEMLVREQGIRGLIAQVPKPNLVRYRSSNQLHWNLTGGGCLRSPKYPDDERNNCENFHCQRQNSPEYSSRFTVQDLLVHLGGFCEIVSHSRLQQCPRLHIGEVRIVSPKVLHPVRQFTKWRKAVPISGRAGLRGKALQP